MNTLSAPAIIRNVERYLAQQYAKREVVQHPVDGVVVMWFKIVRIAKKVGGQWRKLTFTR